MGSDSPNQTNIAHDTQLKYIQINAPTNTYFNI